MQSPCERACCDNADPPLFVGREMRRLESCALLLAERCETRVRESVVGIEVVEPLAVANTVDGGSHVEMGKR